MQRSFLRQAPLIHHIFNPTAASTARRFATAPHPNPGNFANRPKDKLARAGRKGGRKSGKAHAGSFQSMDPEKQHEIASRGGRAVNKASAEHHRPGGRSYRQVPSAIAQHPSAAAPGYEPDVPA